MSEWISVEDRLPKMGERVLGINQFDECEVISREKPWKGTPEQWSWGTFGIFYPTHWIPLPEPPKGST